MKDHSFRQVIKSTSIIGSASIVNVAINIFKIKIAAILLGVEGIGLIGIFSNFISAASQIIGMGYANTGTKKIATLKSEDNFHKICEFKKILYTCTLIVCVLSSLIFFLSSEYLAIYLLNDKKLNVEVLWVGFGAILMVISATQTAILNGLQLLKDIAVASILSATGSAILGIYIIYIYGTPGIMGFIVVAPLVSILINAIYLHKQKSKLNFKNGNILKFKKEIYELNKISFVFMLAGLAGPLGQSLIRIVIDRLLGLEAVGNYQAASTISMNYIGFILGPMMVEYYPRLASVISDEVKVNKVVNDQCKLALLLCTPLLILLMGVAPWAIRVLYSHEFEYAISLLRWQILADLFKIVSWPLSIMLFATSSGKAASIIEYIVLFVFIINSIIIIPYIGLSGAGISYLIMYIVFLYLVYRFACKKTKFKWSYYNKLAFYKTLIVLVVIFTLSIFSSILSLITSILIFFIYIYFNYKIIYNLLKT